MRKRSEGLGHSNRRSGEKAKKTRMRTEEEVSGVWKKG